MQLDGVGKRYGLRQPWVVRDVSLEVAAGQLIRLEGRNGSGKSPLLRVAAGMTVPSAGRVSGRPSTGYVPERFPGGLAFSAREYLIHMGRIHGLRGPSVSAAVDDWLGRLGAADYAGAPLRTLSKGMCQKVAIAQALPPRPGLLVLDEAWTGLDQAARGTLDAAVSERLAYGGTVMFVDHHQARLAGQVSERWQLGGGQVRVLDGPGAASAGVAVPGAPAATEAGVAVPGAPAATVLIELSGLDPESVPQLARMTGVVSVRPVPGKDQAGTELAEGPVRLRVRVLAVASDGLLRQLLSWDDVHVVEVRAGPGGALRRGGGRLVTALLRYQAAILFRSHRWVFPLISYVLLISVAGVGQKQPVSEGLDWSAAMLLPVVALLTRSMLTAEPGASRACVAAAAGPRRAQLAVLITGLAGGAVLGLAGAGYEIVTTGSVLRQLHSHPGVLVASLGAGLGKAVICAFVGSAVGTFCNPPVIRHQAVALLSTIAAVVVALVSSVSPASAALRGSGAAVQSASWPTGVPFLAAAVLLVASWLVSAGLAARRGS